MESNFVICARLLKFVNSVQSVITYLTVKSVLRFIVTTLSFALAEGARRLMLQ